MFPALGTPGIQHRVCGGEALCAKTPSEKGRRAVRSWATHSKPWPSLLRADGVFLFLFFKTQFYLFIYFCLCRVFTALVLASHRRGFSCCRAQAVGTRASVVAAHGLSSCGAQALDTLRHVGSSPTRDWTHDPCTGRQIPIHCNTAEVWWSLLKIGPSEVIQSLALSFPVGRVEPQGLGVGAWGPIPELGPCSIPFLGEGPGRGSRALLSWWCMFSWARSIRAESQLTAYSLEAGSPRSRCQLLFWATGFLLCPYVAEGAELLCRLASVGALIWVPRALPSHPNHLLKAPLSNTITLGVRIPTWKFGGYTNIQTAAFIHTHLYLFVDFSSGFLGLLYI